MFDIVRFKGDLEQLLNRYIAGGPVEDYREMADFLRDVGDQIDHRADEIKAGPQDRRGCQVPETDAATAVIGGSTPLRLVDGAYCRPDGKVVIVVRDLKHHLFVLFAGHLLGQGAGFLGSSAR